ncbi:hypothetical protein PUN28_006967 [Cardiocondyla obscurior]|uniref:Secreted protein n=1 Tax=Cardiocondyla obscurior TaxID=286306 RepID=A0AAW2G3T1_9HYME
MSRKEFRNIFYICFIAALFSTLRPWPPKRSRTLDDLIIYKQGTNRQANLFAFLCDAGASSRTGARQPSVLVIRRSPGGSVRTSAARKKGGRSRFRRIRRHRAFNSQETMITARSDCTFEFGFSETIC